MRPFRFRAQPALDLRQRHDDEAERALAIASAATRQAEERVAAARTALLDAQLGGSQAFGQVTAAQELIWQGNWIVGLERDVARARQTLEERRIEERSAAEIAQHARMQVRVLERLKDRAFQAWQLESRRAEQKSLDELASLRFAARQLAAGE
jgi:flagellar export protein FliJ